MNQQVYSQGKKAEKTIDYSHPFTISMTIFTGITVVILMYNGEKG